jgi:hypothetical protein
MKKETTVFLLLAVSVFFSCSKSEKQVSTLPKIDVSRQWIIDPLGNLVNGLLDDQWQPKNYTPDEIGFFASLDSADLSGTNTPDSLYAGLNAYNYIFPNPFFKNSGLGIVFKFNNGFNGQMVLKMVIVDSNANTVYASALRIQGVSNPGLPNNPSYSKQFRLSPNTSLTGKFRLYYTLSTQSKPHFFKSWGNIHMEP